MCRIAFIIWANVTAPFTCQLKVSLEYLILYIDVFNMLVFKGIMFQCIDVFVLKLRGSEIGSHVLLQGITSFLDQLLAYSVT